MSLQLSSPTLWQSTASGALPAIFNTALCSNAHMKACSRSGAVEQDEELGISSTSLSGRAALSRLLARYCQRRLLGIVHDAHREAQELCQQNAGTGARVVHPAPSLGKHDDAHTAQPDKAARRFRDPRLRLQVQRQRKRGELFLHACEYSETQELLTDSTLSRHFLR